MKVDYCQRFFFQVVIIWYESWSIFDEYMLTVEWLAKTIRNKRSEPSMTYYPATVIGFESLSSWHCAPHKQITTAQNHGHAVDNHEYCSINKKSESLVRCQFPKWQLDHAPPTFQSCIHAVFHNEIHVIPAFKNWNQNTCICLENRYYTNDNSQ